MKKLFLPLLAAATLAAGCSTTYEGSRINGRLPGRTQEALLKNAATQTAAPTVDLQATGYQIFSADETARVTDKTILAPAIDVPVYVFNSSTGLFDEERLNLTGPRNGAAPLLNNLEGLIQSNADHGTLEFNRTEVANVSPIANRYHFDSGLQVLDVFHSGKDNGVHVNMKKVSRTRGVHANDRYKVALTLGQPSSSVTQNTLDYLGVAESALFVGGSGLAGGPAGAAVAGGLTALDEVVGFLETRKGMNATLSYANPTGDARLVHVLRNASEAKARSLVAVPYNTGSGNYGVAFAHVGTGIENLSYDPESLTLSFTTDREGANLLLRGLYVGAKAAVFTGYRHSDKGLAPGQVPPSNVPSDPGAPGGGRGGSIGGK